MPASSGSTSPHQIQSRDGPIDRQHYSVCRVSILVNIAILLASWRPGIWHPVSEVKLSKWNHRSRAAVAHAENQQQSIFPSRRLESFHAETDKS